MIKSHSNKTLVAEDKLTWLKQTSCYVKRFLLVTFTLALGLSLAGCMHSHGVLNPDGVVAKRERALLFETLAIMMIVVLPVIVMSIAFAIRYRDRHDNKSKYRPNWAHNTLLEVAWWTVPTVIIIILAIITWKTSHSLDPYRHISAKTSNSEIQASSKKPLIIQAISLRWKWLFIYPQQGIATVNTLTLPVDRPVEFMLTSEAPMSAFFIPQLSSQVYVMAGMQTKLNLIANKLTNGAALVGKNAQYNGPGFSWNTFAVNIVKSDKFKQWSEKIKHDKSYSELSVKSYIKDIWQPINNHSSFPIRYFSKLKQPKLYMCIMQKYHLPLAEDSPFSKNYYRHLVETGKWKDSCAYQLYKLSKKFPQTLSNKSEHGTSIRISS